MLVWKTFPGVDATCPRALLPDGGGLHVEVDDDVDGERGVGVAGRSGSSRDERVNVFVIDQLGFCGPINRLFKGY